MQIKAGVEKTKHSEAWYEVAIASNSIQRQRLRTNSTQTYV